MKIKNIIPLAGIVLLIVPFTVNLFVAPFFSTHDGVAHAVRLAKFYQNLTEGELIPRWASGVAFNLGSPALMFNGQLGYYLSSLIHFLGFGVTQSLSLNFALSWIVSGLSCFLFLQKLFGKRAAFVGALTYTLAPYRFVDIFVRGEVTENLSFALTPLLFLVFLNYYKSEKKLWLLLGGLLVALLLLSHSVMFLLFMGTFLGFCLVWGFVRGLLKGVFVTALGLLLGSFYLLPAFFEKSYSNLDKLNLYPAFYSNFLSPSQLIYSKWGWGPLHSTSPMSLQIGPVQILMVVVSIGLLTYLSFGKPAKELSTIYRLAWYFLAVLVVGIFLMLPVSTIFWQKLPLLPFVLYPWRILGLVIFCAAFLTAFVTVQLKNNLLLMIVTVVLLLYTNRNYGQIVGKVYDPDSYYLNYNDTTDMWGEYLPVTANLDFVKDCKIKQCWFPKLAQNQDLTILSSQEKSTSYQVEFKAQKDLLVTFNTFYFPGWKFYLDGEATQFKLNPIGTVDLNLPQGEHSFLAKFEDTPLRAASLWLSIITLVGCLGWLLWKK